VFLVSEIIGRLSFAVAAIWRAVAVAVDDSDRSCQLCVRIDDQRHLADEAGTHIVSGVVKLRQFVADTAIFRSACYIVWRGCEYSC